MREQRFIATGWRPAQEVGDLDILYLARIVAVRWHPAGKRRGSAQRSAPPAARRGAAATQTSPAEGFVTLEGIYVTIAHHEGRMDP
jgi:hypothetical protein